MNYAGFWIRLGAYILDALIMYAVSFVVLMLCSLVVNVSAVLMGDLSPFMTILLAITFIGYYVFFNGGTWQATPGKRIVGIHISTVDGDRITYLRAFVRLLANIASALPLYLGYVMIAFTREKRGLHDYIAGTVVTYGKKN